MNLFISSILSREFISVLLIRSVHDCHIILCYSILSHSISGGLIPVTSPIGRESKIPRTVKYFIKKATMNFFARYQKHVVGMYLLSKLKGEMYIQEAFSKSCKLLLICLIERNNRIITRTSGSWWWTRHAWTPGLGIVYYGAVSYYLLV